MQNIRDPKCENGVAEIYQGFICEVGGLPGWDGVAITWFQARESKYLGGRGRLTKCHALSIQFYHKKSDIFTLTHGKINISHKCCGMWVLDIDSDCRCQLRFWVPEVLWLDEHFWTITSTTKMSQETFANSMHLNQFGLFAGALNNTGILLWSTIKVHGEVALADPFWKLIFSWNQA